ncbi:flagellar protein FliT [Clostridium sp. DSM 100503]|uniref:flagellar protein FliT n=1 Tax=Clostridium sp. DSM 100503 TaxID=2963282 RepID=UPI00214A11A2|nr:flagellar protein FliT [Clostridium sp. DSM 100503]MCR1950196.1 flagellar protein FliT [Clostridium sp. DSM 100503]
MVDMILDDYKKITEDIISNLKDDLPIDELMNIREELIHKLFDQQCIGKNEIKELYISKGLLEIDKKLRISIEEQQLKVKEEIRNLHNIKNANNAYEKNRRINSFFSTKI